jgi:hypothetical protein
MADREVSRAKVNRADQPLEGPTSLDSPWTQLALGISSRKSDQNRGCITPVDGPVRRLEPFGVVGSERRDHWWADASSEASPPVAEPEVGRAPPGVKLEGAGGRRPAA